MFQHRPAQFDSRVAAIADHLRAIEKELAGIGGIAGRRASAGASAAGDQIADVIGPILSEITDRFRRGRRVAIDEAASAGSDAMRFGARVGGDALGRISTQAKDHPLLTIAVAIGAGFLIGMAGRRLS
jgi:hypothetical protein